MSDLNFSIIIPHYNIPKLLQRCLDSIPQRPDLEVIVVDDNSSPDIVDFDHFPGSDRPDVTLILDKKGGGGGYARNLGLDAAKGKWLLFADSDDYYVEGAFDVIDRELSDEIDILFFNIKLEGCWLTKFTSFHKSYEQYTVDGNSIPIRFGKWQPWNKVISAKVVHDNKIRFEEVPVGNDALFALNAAKYCERYKIIQDRLYTYTSSNSGSLSQAKMDFNRLMLHTAVRVRINLFFAENGYYRLILLLLGRSTIRSMIRNYGWRKTFIYFRYVKKYFGLGKYLRCRILKKLHL